MDDNQIEVLSGFLEPGVWTFAKHILIRQVGHNGLFISIDCFASISEKKNVEPLKTDILNKYITFEITLTNNEVTTGKTHIKTYNELCNRVKLSKKMPTNISKTSAKDSILGFAFLIL